MESHVEVSGLCRLAVKISGYDRDMNLLHIETDSASDKLTINLDRSGPRDYRPGELYEFWTQIVGDTHYLLTAFQLNIYEYDILRDTLRLAWFPQEACQTILARTSQSPEMRNCSLTVLYTYLPQPRLNCLRELKRSNACTLAKIFLKLVQELLRVWLNLLHEDVQVKQISTAMTNMVYEVTSSIQNYSMDYEDSEAALMEPEKLLLRVYGPSTWMFEREKEERIVYALMSLGISPPWLGVFGNGRIEEFVPSSTVSAQKFRRPEVAKKILAEVHRLHSSLDQVIHLAPLLRENALWGRLELWNMKAEEAFESLRTSIGPEDPKHHEMIQTLLSWNIFNGATLKILKERASQCHSPLVFGHCDLHHGNVLLKLSTKAYIIIDYEYAMITSRGFDLANYFWEHCTDYDSPTPEIPNKDLFPDHELLLDLLGSYEQRCGSDEECSPEEIAREIYCFLPLVHLHWGLWGIIKAAEGSSKFDYLQYAVERLFQVFQSDQVLSL